MIVIVKNAPGGFFPFQFSIFSGQPEFLELTEDLMRVVVIVFVVFIPAKDQSNTLGRWRRRYRHINEQLVTKLTLAIFVLFNAVQRT